MKFFTPIARVLNSPTVRLIAERRQNVLKQSIEAHTLCSKPTYYGILYKNDQKEWRIADKYGVEQIPCGVYTFVRTVTGFIRVAPAPQGTTNHLEVANHAAEIRYAGEIAFNTQGKMLSWNNQSGGYRPNFYHASQAGLPLELFCPVYSDTNRLNQQSIENPVKKRKLSDVGFVTASHNQANDDGQYAQLRAKKRQGISVPQNAEICRALVSCTA